MIAVLVAVVVTGSVGYLHYQLSIAECYPASYAEAEDEEYRPRREKP